MTKALITVGADPNETTGYRELLALAEPTFIRYAKKWGYDYKAVWYDDIDAARWPGIINERTPTWRHDPSRTAPYYLKIPAVAEALDRYDLVFYLDSDCLILDDSRDIEDDFPLDKLLAFNHHFYGGSDTGPFASVSLTRSIAMTKKFWKDAWGSDAWRNCRWHDNAGIQELLGYNTSTDPMRKLSDTEYTPFYHRLADDWIGEGNGNPGVPEPGCRIYHASHGRAPEVKVEWMRRALGIAAPVPPPEPPDYDTPHVILSHGRTHL